MSPCIIERDSDGARMEMLGCSCPECARLRAEVERLKALEQQFALIDKHFPDIEFGNLLATAIEMEQAAKAVEGSNV